MRYICGELTYDICLDNLTLRDRIYVLRQKLRNTVSSFGEQCDVITNNIERHQFFRSENVRAIDDHFIAWDDLTGHNNQYFLCV